MLKSVVIAVALCWSVAVLQAQEQLHARFSHWTVDDGLTSGEVRCLVSDWRGLLWIGTNGGLTKFDGQVMQRFVPGVGDHQLPDGRVNGLFLADSTTLYIGTEGGLCRMDLQTEILERIPLDTPDGVHYERVESITPLRDGRLILAFEHLLPSQGGLLLLDTETLELSPYLQQVEHNPGGMHAIEDPEQDGVIWHGGWDYLTRVDTHTGSFQNLNPPGKEGGFFQYHDLQALNDSTLLIPRYGNGIYTLNTRTLAWTLTCEVPLVVNVEMLTDSTCLICTNDRGVGVVNLNTHEAAFYPVEQGNIFALSEDDTDVGLKDAEGRVWIGNDNGLSMIDPYMQQFETVEISPEYSSENDFRLGNLLAHPSEDVVVVGGPLGDGLYLLNSKTMKVQEHIASYTGGPFDSKPLPISQMLFMGPDSLVFSNAQGLFWMNWNTRRMEPLVLQSNPWVEGDLLTHMVALPGSTVVTGGSKGKCFEIQTQTKTVIPHTLVETSTGQRTRLLGLHAGPEGIWMSCNQAVGRWNPVTRSFELLQDLIPGFDPQEEGRILRFLQPNDSILYVATQVQGMSQYNLNTGERYQVLAAGESYWCNRMIEDSDGNIWAGTSRGLLRFDPRSKVAQLFNRTNGMAWSDCHRAGIDIDRDGNLWTSIRGFVVRIAQAEVTPNPELPAVVLQSIRVNGEPLESNKLAASLQRLTLSPGQDQLSFTCSARAFTQPDQVTYAYRLKGFEEGWHEAGGSGYGNYTNLPDGEYTLQIRAANGDGAWGKVHAIELKVKPLFYQTTWFLILAALVAIGLVVGIIQIRSKRAREKARIQAEFEKRIAEVEMGALRAQMNPHFLFNCLNSIKFFIIQNRVEEAADYLTKFARLIRLILNNSKTELVPLGAELDALDLYVQMERLRFQDQFSYSIEVEEGVDRDGISVPPLLIQPFVENAIWHGLMHRESPGHLDIRVTRTGNMLTCQVHDNGVGREKAAELRSKQSVKRKSLGMDITQNRVETINQLYNSNAHIAVDDLYEDGAAAGTLVTIEIPLQ